MLMGEKRIIFGMLASAGLFLLSCKKDGFSPKIFTNVDTHSEICVTNASPGSAGMFVLIDDQHVSFSSQLYHYRHDALRHDQRWLSPTGPDTGWREQLPG